MSEENHPTLYRPEFEAALRLFAQISEAMARRNLPRPILVGGAAVAESPQPLLRSG